MKKIFLLTGTFIVAALISSTMYMTKEPGRESTPLAKISAHGCAEITTLCSSMQSQDGTVAIAVEVKDKKALKARILTQDLSSEDYERVDGEFRRAVMFNFQLTELSEDEFLISLENVNLPNGVNKDDLAKLAIAELEKGHLI